MYKSPPPLDGGGIRPVQGWHGMLPPGYPVTHPGRYSQDHNGNHPSPQEELPFMLVESLGHGFT